MALQAPGLPPSRFLPPTPYPTALASLHASISARNESNETVNVLPSLTAQKEKQTKSCSLFFDELLNW